MNPSTTAAIWCAHCVRRAPMRNHRLCRRCNGSSIVRDLHGVGSGHEERDRMQRQMECYERAAEFREHEPPSEMPPDCLPCVAYPRCRAVVPVNALHRERCLRLHCPWAICPACQEAARLTRDTAD